MCLTPSSAYTEMAIKMTDAIRLVTNHSECLTHLSIYPKTLCRFASSQCSFFRTWTNPWWLCVEYISHYQQKWSKYYYLNVYVLYHHGFILTFKIYKHVFHLLRFVTSIRQLMRLHFNRKHEIAITVALVDFWILEVLTIAHSFRDIQLAIL